MELTDFLLARIAEDELSVLVASNNPKWSWASVDFNSSDAAQFGHRFDPARMLAECEAKRRIVEISNLIIDGDPYEIDSDAPSNAKEILRALAAIYSDHLDFDPAWA